MVGRGGEAEAQGPTMWVHERHVRGEVRSMCGVKAALVIVTQDPSMERVSQ